MKGTVPMRLRLLALCSLILLAGCAKLEFTLVFKDVKNLQVGDPLIYKGMTVGEVTAIQLDGKTVRVGVKVLKEHRNVVYREAAYVIEAPNGFFDTSGERQITMRDRGTARSAVQTADVLEGSEGLPDMLKEKVQDVAGKVLERALGK